MILVRAANSPVHMVPLDRQQTPSAELRTGCGRTLPLDEVEQVDEFGDDPCPTCSELDDDPPGRNTEPEQYAVALRGSHVRHLVAEDAARGELDGRPVVQTRCARLAWGPLTTGPEHWPLCPQCQQHTGGPG